MNRFRKVTVFLVLVSALAAQMMSPISVRADGKVTPEATESSEITETPAPTEAPTDAAPTETPAASDSPEPDPVITETPAPPDGAESLTETPATELPPVDDERKHPTEILHQTESPTPEPTGIVVPDTAENATLLETVGEISADIDLIVLDEKGELLPLALQSAADVIAESDPMWCPAGETPGGAGCSASYTTVTDLIFNIGSVDNGTIYFTAAPVYSTNDVQFFSATNLTIQGGWNGLTGKGNYAINGNTTFTVPIQIIGSSGNITINNVTVNGAAGVGIGVEGGADVNINNSNVTNTTASFSSYFPWGDGMDIFTSGDVTITNSTISNNNYDGIYGYANSYSINGSTFTGNGLNGFGSGLNVATNSTVWFGSSATDFDNTFVDISIICPGGYLGMDFPDGVTTSLQNTSIGTDCVATVQLPGDTVTNQDKTGSTPTGQVFVPASASKVSFYLDCSKSQRTFTINLPNGDKVEIVCPVDGKAAITRMDNTTLPGPLPDGYTFASAFKLEILQVEQPPQREGNDFKRWSIPYIDEGGHVKISFVAPSVEVGNNYSILYWDNGTWLPLKDFMLDSNGLPERFSLDPGADPPDERVVISGVEFILRGDASRVEVSTNFPGIFVLAQR